MGDARSRVACVLVAIGLAACDAPPAGAPHAVVPAIGATSFVSADPWTATAPTYGDGSWGTDSYRVLGDQRLLLLRGAGGLEIIDIRDLAAPQIEGHLLLSGEGAGLEVDGAGSRAVALLNHSAHYRRVVTGSAVALEANSGAALVRIDILDRAHPKIIDRTIVPGEIIAQKVTRSGARAALYVAWLGPVDQAGERSAHITSYDLNADMLVQRDQRDLGTGFVHADLKGDVLVLSDEPHSDDPGSTLALFELSRADGVILEHGTLVAAGYAYASSFGIQDGVLPVVSSTDELSMGSYVVRSNVEAFDIRGPRPRRVAHCQMITSDRATGFPIDADTVLLTWGAAGNSTARFQEYWTQALALGDDGRCQGSEPILGRVRTLALPRVLGETRLLRFGLDGDAHVVDLFDAAGLEMGGPPLASVELGHVPYDLSFAPDRILEGAVSIAAADGTIETGLILLPLERYPEDGPVVHEIQLVTFSDHTLTLRGAMQSEPLPEASFLINGVTANPSYGKLHLTDIGNPDQPRELGKLEWPDNRHVFVFGDAVARTNYDFASLYHHSGDTPPPMTVELVPRALAAASTTPIASFEVPAEGALMQVGNLLVSITAQEIDDPLQPGNRVEQTAIAVYDLSDPRHPARRGSLETPGPPPYFRRPDLAATTHESYDTYSGGSYTEQQDWYVFSAGIAFARRIDQHAGAKPVRDCTLSADPPCGRTRSGAPGCPGTSIEGRLRCYTPAGRDEWCEGAFERCDAATGACAPIDRDSVRTRTECTVHNDFRHWQALALDVLDLRDPDAPAFAPKIEFALEEESSTLIADASSLYANFQMPAQAGADSHPAVQRFFRKIDLTDPQHPLIGAAINVPGFVTAVADGSIFTHDLVWDAMSARTLVSRLTVGEASAQLQATQLIAGRTVEDVRLDGAGHVLVSHHRDVPPAPEASSLFKDPAARASTLTVLDATDLGVRSELAIEVLGSSIAASDGLALYRADRGVLVVDTRDALHPMARSYLPVPPPLPSAAYFGEGEIVFAGAANGVYSIATDLDNLDAP